MNTFKKVVRKRFPFTVHLQTNLVLSIDIYEPYRIISACFEDAFYALIYSEENTGSDKWQRFDIMAIQTGAAYEYDHDWTFLNTARHESGIDVHFYYRLSK